MVAPLIRIKPAGTKPAFFCVAQGNIVGLERLAANLPDDRAFYGLQSQALHQEMLSDITIESLATEYLEELRRVQPHGPYLLGGRCTGSIIAFEMAKRLRAEGEEVPLLAVMDTIRPPSAVALDGSIAHPGLDEAANFLASSAPRAATFRRRLVKKSRHLKRRFLLAQHERKIWAHPVDDVPPAPRVSPRTIRRPDYAFQIEQAAAS